MSRHALLIMNARDIEECVRSLGGLEVDRFWLRGFAEAYLEGPIGDLIAATDYDYYSIVSDDVVVTPAAFDAVRLAADDDVAVSGWCNLDLTDWGLRMASIVRTPFAVNASVRENYDWVPIAEVLGGGLLRETWFCGMCMTCMSRDMWLRFPFMSPGQPSDFSLSWRLQEADVPIYAVRDAGVFHVKEQTDPWRLDEDPRKALVHLRTGAPQVIRQLAEEPVPA